MSMASMMPVDPSASVMNKVRVVVICSEAMRAFAASAWRRRASATGSPLIMRPFRWCRGLGPPEFSMEVSACAHVSRQRIFLSVKAPQGAVQPVVANLRPPSSRAASQETPFRRDELSGCAAQFLLFSSERRDAGLKF